ncbi:MAG: phage tail tape measure protein [Rhodospirillaceae bacterium]|nr:MAG: phage tail tape measure protein [Rhodospirillaceae bacterium]
MLNAKIVLSAVDRITAPVRKIGASFSKMARQIQKSSRLAANAMRKLRDRTRQLSDVGKKLSTRVTLPIVGLGAAVIKTGGDFEEALSKIIGLVGVAQSQVAAWRQDVLKLAPAVGKGPNELAEALFFVTSAGARGAQALEVLNVSAKAAAAGLGDTVVVADAVTSAMNAYGAETLSAGRATGILVATVREGKAEASAIASALGRIIPLASQLGVGFDQVGASVAAMTQQGSKAAEAVTALRGILGGILTPSGKAEETFKKFGLSAAGLQKMMREDGLLATLLLLKNRFGDNQQAMAEAFPEMEALTGILSLIGKNAEATKKIFKSLAEAGVGDLNKAFKAASSTSNFKFRQAMASISVLLIRLSEAVFPVLLPMIVKFTGFVERLAARFRNLSPKTKETIVTLVALAAAIGPLLVILGTLGFAITGIGLLFTATPFGLFIVGIAAITAGTVALIAYWEDLGEIFSNIATPALNFLGFGGDSVASGPPVRSASEGAVGVASQFSGKLAIQIESDRPVRVRDLRSDNRNIDLDVDTGPVMVGG